MAAYTARGTHHARTTPAMPEEKSTSKEKSGAGQPDAVPERGSSDAAATERNEGRNKGTPTSGGDEPIQKQNKTTSNV